MNKTVWPPGPNSSANKPEVVPTPSRAPLLPGIIVGFLLYGGTSVAGLIALESGFIPTQYAGPFSWPCLILLSNILPVGLYFCCKQKFHFLALGFLGGSLFGSAIHLIYALSAWYEAFVTAPGPA